MYVNRNGTENLQVQVLGGPVITAQATECQQGLHSHVSPAHTPAHGMEGHSRLDPQK